MKKRSQETPPIPPTPPKEATRPGKRLRPTFGRLVAVAPLSRLPPQVREHEVRRRLRYQLEVLEDTLRDGADVAERLPRLKALNVVRAVKLALDHGVTDTRLDELDQAACRLIDNVGAMVPAPGNQGHLSKENRPSWDKRLLLERIHIALEVAQVPMDLRRNGRVERRHIEAQWEAIDRGEPEDKAWTVAGCAIGALDNLLLRQMTGPVTTEPMALIRDQRAIARAIRLLIDMGIASEQNVAFVALHYFGVDWGLRKNFFKGVAREWEKERDELWGKYGDLIMQMSRDG